MYIWINPIRLGMSCFSSYTAEDFDGQFRTGITDCGSDQYYSSSEIRPTKRITNSDVGPSSNTNLGD
jgi:hypothetical protein